MKEVGGNRPIDPFFDDGVKPGPQRIIDGRYGDARVDMVKHVARVIVGFEKFDPIGVVGGFTIKEDGDFILYIAHRLSRVVFRRGGRWRL